MEALKKTSNPNMRKQQVISSNIKKLKTVIENKETNILKKYIYICIDLNKQSVEIHKEKHLYLMWKISQMLSVSDQRSSNQQQKKNLIEDILEDLNLNISQIDFELEEMREQQLCVDLSIENYYKKISQYPKSLKKLFDIGTYLLTLFNEFYSSWYNFQCEVQQRFYNHVLSLDQQLNLAQMSNTLQLKQLEKVIL